MTLTEKHCTSFATIYALIRRGLALLKIAPRLYNSLLKSPYSHRDAVIRIPLLLGNLADRGRDNSFGVLVGKARSCALGYRGCMCSAGKHPKKEAALKNLIMLAMLLAVTALVEAAVPAFVATSACANTGGTAACAAPLLSSAAGGTVGCAMSNFFDGIFGFFPNWSGFFF
jgi:hypothetical protein